MYRKKAKELLKLKKTYKSVSFQLKRSIP
jgi:hypothetical protein